MEDGQVTPEKRTKDILAQTMQGVEEYLAFTMESGEDFEGGWLPTLDTALRVGEDNLIQFRFFEKETTSQRTVQKRTAMEQNSKMQVVANDLVRRLCNTMEEVGGQEIIKVVDNYTQKLLNSGYTVEETRAIIVKGLKGYEGRKNRCKREGRSLWRTAAQSGGARQMKKLTAKSSWYRSRKKRDDYGADKTRSGEQRKDVEETITWEQKAVLFIEQTREGELGKQLREVVQRLAPLMGFSIKIVERTGSTLKSKFPQSSLWEGAGCGRDRCVTCNQGAETLAPCMRKSLVYENICADCNEGAGGKEEVTGSNPDIPSIYVGETSRTIFERANEHWGAAKGSKAARAKSHIAKHQELVHEGREPNFMMRTVKFHKTALSRQTGEAVRIRRRGGEGAVLNSRGEFNRSFIPRLQLVEEQVIKELETAEEEEQEETRRQLVGSDGDWEQRKARDRAAPKLDGSRSSRSKRSKGSHGARPLKRFKFDIIPEGWGSLTINKEEAKTTSKQRGVCEGDVTKDGMMIGGGSPPDKEEGVGGRSGNHPPPPPTIEQPTPLLTTHGKAMIQEGGEAHGRALGMVSVETDVMTSTGRSGDIEEGHCDIEDNTPGDKTDTQYSMNGMVPGDKMMSNDVKKDVMMMSNGVKGDRMMKDDREVMPSSDQLMYEESQEYRGGRSFQGDKTQMMNMMICEDEAKGEDGREDDGMGDMVIPGACDDDDNQPGAPSSVSLCEGGERDQGTSQECEVAKGVCRNGCKVRTISYTVKKRVQNKKTLLWYDRSKKISKFVCVRESSNRANLANSSTQREVVKRI